MTEGEKTRLDAAFPPRGPCGFCSGDDARHRGESVEELAQDYALTADAVELALARVRAQGPEYAAHLLADD